MRTVGLIAARGLLLCVGLILCAETTRAEPLVPDAAQLATMPGWSVLESAHFRFHFSPSSGVEDQHAFAATEERILSELLAYFGGPLSGKIDFYVWKDDAEAMSVLGRTLAFAIPATTKKPSSNKRFTTITTLGTGMARRSAPTRARSWRCSSKKTVRSTPLACSPPRWPPTHPTLLSIRDARWWSHCAQPSCCRRGRVS